MPDQERFHLTLSTGGRPVMHGWWPDQATAERKLAGWVGEFGAVDQAAVTLTDTATGTVLEFWPKD
jgi:hypothetical protein